MLPNIKSINIKNDKKDEYSNLNKSNRFAINSSGYISDTNINYETSKTCQYSSDKLQKLELDKKGVYIDTLNQPDAPYYYLIFISEKPNGCYGIKINDIWMDGSLIRIGVSESLPPYNAICTDAEAYPSICVTIYDQTLKVQVEERIDSGLAELLSPYN